MTVYALWDLDANEPNWPICWKVLRYNRGNFGGIEFDAEAVADLHLLVEG